MVKKIKKMFSDNAFRRFSFTLAEKVILITGKKPSLLPVNRSGKHVIVIGLLN